MGDTEAKKNLFSGIKKIITKKDEEPVPEFAPKEDKLASKVEKEMPEADFSSEIPPAPEEIQGFTEEEENSILAEIEKIELDESILEEGKEELDKQLAQIDEKISKIDAELDELTKI